MNRVNDEISQEGLISLQESMNRNDVILVKFGAEWCNPCKKIKEKCYENFNKLPNNVYIYDIDVDEHLDLYGKLKTKKMLKGLPTILAYYGGKKEHWYIPDDSFSGSDLKDLDSFFHRCNQMARGERRVFF